MPVPSRFSIPSKWRRSIPVCMRPEPKPGIGRCFLLEPLFQLAVQVLQFLFLPLQAAFISLAVLIPMQPVFFQFRGLSGQLLLFLVPLGFPFFDPALQVVGRRLAEA